MTRPRRADVPDAVCSLLASWPQADDISRSVASYHLGAPPTPDAVPYRWLTWQLRKKVRGEDHAIYNALRRTIGRMDAAGEVITYSFTDNGHYAWIVPVLLQKSVTKPMGEPAQ